MLTNMGTIGFCLCSILFIKVELITGQSLQQEELLNITTCDLRNVNLNCASDDVIAFQSAHFYYHATCSSICCSYSSGQDTLEATPADIAYIRRQCSGKNSCSLDVDGVRAFASGGNSPTHAILYYHCIQKSRTASICSTKKLTSGGSLLYLTNEDFPFVTTDHRSCSCSLEVFSCKSGVNMYLIDADMYLDEANCQQGINIFDGKNASLFDITYASYYTNEISTSSFATTNYIRIDFTDNSTANQEGIFFIGFGATEPNVTFKLSCAAEQQTTCIDCGELYTILNGNLTATVGGSTTFGAKANVACDPGYQVTGYCNRITEFQCGDGTCINNSSRCDNFPDCPDHLDELLCEKVISCLEGQKLCDVTCVNEQVTCEGAESETSVAEPDAGTISCLVIGKWEKVRCSAKDCGTPTEIENGNITLIEDGKTTYMSTADVNCDTGYTPTIALIACQADGTWKNGTCNIIDCGDPTPTAGILNDTTNFEYGAVIEVTCISGYDPIGSTPIICQANGTWSGSPTCDPKDCGKLIIQNGQFTAPSGTTLGEIATQSCNTGYTFSGVETVSCTEAGWNASAATCTIVDCGDPTPTAGILNDTTNFEYGAVIEVTCISGYDPIGSTPIICQANGTWSGSPTCDPKDCGKLIIQNGQFTAPSGTTLGEIATQSCNTGYTFSGVETVSCTEAGWNASAATCTIVDCGDPTPTAGILNDTTNFEYGAVIEVTCISGDDPIGSTPIICQANDTWSGSPTCDPKDCGTLIIQNGQFTAPSGTTLGEIATQSCNTGYTFSGEETVSCTEAGWNASAATCTIVDCGEPYTILHGTVSTLISGVTSLGARAIVTCDQGYQVKREVDLIGAEEISKLKNIYKNGISCPGAVTCEDGGSSETETEARIISCLEKGKWERVQCLPKDTAQKETGNSSTILVIILACLLTAALSIALTLIVLFVVRKYKRPKPNTLTPPPEHDVYYNTEQSLDNNEGDSHQYERLNETSASGTTYSTLDVNDSTNQ